MSFSVQIRVDIDYIVGQGNITATIIWLAITTGATAGSRTKLLQRKTIALTICPNRFLLFGSVPDDESMTA